jgi:hypothetical protein
VDGVTPLDNAADRPEFWASMEGFLGIDRRIERRTKPEVEPDPTTSHS